MQIKHLWTVFFFAVHLLRRRQVLNQEHKSLLSKHPPTVSPLSTQNKAFQSELLYNTYQA